MDIKVPGLGLYRVHNNYVRRALIIVTCVPVTLLQILYVTIARFLAVAVMVSAALAMVALDVFYVTRESRRAHCSTWRMDAATRSYIAVHGPYEMRP